MPEAGMASWLPYRCFIGTCVPQVCQPANPENGQGGFASSLPPLTRSRTRLNGGSAVTRANSEQPQAPDNSGPENGPTNQKLVTPLGGHTPSTEDSEMPSFGGLRFVQLTEEEGEKVWERVFAPPVTAFIPPDETDPKTHEPELTRNQLRNLTISFLDQLIASPPPATPESNMPSPDRLPDNSVLETDATETTQSPSAATKPPDPASPSARPVPPGLVRCPVCNEYRGTIDIDDQSPHSRRDGDVLSVLCICDGVLCPRCKINRFHRPISNVWTERAGLGHIPYLRAGFPCDECRAKEHPESTAKRP